MGFKQVRPQASVELGRCHQVLQELGWWFPSLAGRRIYVEDLAVTDVQVCADIPTPSCGVKPGHWARCVLLRRLRCAFRGGGGNGGSLVLRDRISRRASPWLVEVK